MNPIDAMRQALDALEHDNTTTNMLGYESRPMVLEAITRLRTAIAEMEKAEPIDVALDPAVNGGWQLVPVEPTKEMLEAGERDYNAKYCDMISPTPTEFHYELGGPMGYAYHAMLAAAPKPKEAE